MACPVKSSPDASGIGMKTDACSWGTPPYVGATPCGCPFGIVRPM